MNDKHTPGPWTAEKKWHTVFDVMAVEINVATIWSFAEEAEVANARLIAAAPDMLIALREAEAALEVAVGRILKKQPEYPVHVTSEHLGLVLVRSAIAQATGDAS